MSSSKSVSVCIRRYTTETEAHIDLGYLRAQGIKGYISGTSSSAFRPHLAFSGMDLMLFVKETDAARALELLDRPEKDQK